MGKPSNSHLSKKSSNSSTVTSENKLTIMNSSKSARQKASRRTKTKNNIYKLFEHLRNTSSTSLNSDTSVICLDTPENVKRKQTNTSIEPENKRQRNSDSSLIIVNDDTLITNDLPCSSAIPETSFTTPKKQPQMQCSTPIQNKINLDDLILANSRNELSVQNGTANLAKEISNITKEINQDSYLTIDLTTETINCSSIDNTVIDLAAIEKDDDKSDKNDCTFISISNAGSMSGDSDVTVLNLTRKGSKDRQMKKFVNGIARMDTIEKARLLELITKNIFSGCNVTNSNSTLGPIPNNMVSVTRATETVQDTYIKEVILGQINSRNSIGSNIYNPMRDLKIRTGPRMVVVDGSNVAMQHTKGRSFSVKGLKICLDYFIQRGHDVKAFVPRFRCKYGKSSDPRLLDELERSGVVVYTPSREVQGRMITPYDDRYIVQCAAEFDGIIVSGDNYRDLLSENPRWKFVIENRLLQFTWVGDMIMFPRDPLGRDGPTLEVFLKHPDNP